MYFVYILQSQKEQSDYASITVDAEKRLLFNNAGYQRYTKAKIPWQIVRLEQFNNKREALIREREIKKKKSKRYIEWLIDCQNRGVVPTAVGAPGL